MYFLVTKAHKLLGTLYRESDLRHCAWCWELTVALFCVSLAELEPSFPEFPSLYIPCKYWLWEKFVRYLEYVIVAATMFLMLWE